MTVVINLYAGVCVCYACFAVWAERRIFHMPMFVAVFNGFMCGLLTPFHLPVVGGGVLYRKLKVWFSKPTEVIELFRGDRLINKETGEEHIVEEVHALGRNTFLSPYFSIWGLNQTCYILATPPVSDKLTLDRFHIVERK